MNDAVNRPNGNFRGGGNRVRGGGNMNMAGPGNQQHMPRGIPQQPQHRQDVQPPVRQTVYPNGKFWNRNNVEQYDWNNRSRHNDRKWVNPPGGYSNSNRNIGGHYPFFPSWTGNYPSWTGGNNHRRHSFDTYGLDFNKFRYDNYGFSSGNQRYDFQFDNQGPYLDYGGQRCYFDYEYVGPNLIRVWEPGGRDYIVRCNNFYGPYASGGVNIAYNNGNFGIGGGVSWGNGGWGGTIYS